MKKGGKRNENRGSIKCGKLKGGKLDGPIQCYYAKHFTLRPVRVYLVLIMVSPKKFHVA